MEVGHLTTGHMYVLVLFQLGHSSYVALKQICYIKVKENVSFSTSEYTLGKRKEMRGETGGELGRSEKSRVKREHSPSPASSLLSDCLQDIIFSTSWL